MLPWRRVDVAAFLDDRLSGTVVRGLPVLTPTDAPASTSYLVGIAAPHGRQRFAGLLDGAWTNTCQRDPPSVDHRTRR